MSPKTLSPPRVRSQPESVSEINGRARRRSRFPLRRVVRFAARLCVGLLALVGLLAATLVGAVLMVVDDDVAWDRVVPEFWASVTELRAVQDQPGDGLVEGRDYAFMRTEQGRLLHWSCGEPIPVILIGKAPQASKPCFSRRLPCSRRRVTCT